VSLTKPVINILIQAELGRRTELGRRIDQATATPVALSEAALTTMRAACTHRTAAMAFTTWLNAAGRSNSFAAERLGLPLVTLAQWRRGSLSAPLAATIDEKVRQFLLDALATAERPLDFSDQMNRWLMRTAHFTSAPFSPSAAGDTHARIPRRNQPCSRPLASPCNHAPGADQHVPFNQTVNEGEHARIASSLSRGGRVGSRRATHAVAAPLNFDPSLPTPSAGELGAVNDAKDTREPASTHKERQSERSQSQPTLTTSARMQDTPMSAQLLGPESEADGSRVAVGPPRRPGTKRAHREPVFHGSATQRYRQSVIQQVEAGAFVRFQTVPAVVEEENRRGAVAYAASDDPTGNLEVHDVREAKQDEQEKDWLEVARAAEAAASTARQAAERALAASATAKALLAAHTLDEETHDIAEAPRTYHVPQHQKHHTYDRNVDAPNWFDPVSWWLAYKAASAGRGARSSHETRSIECGDGHDRTGASEQQRLDSRSPGSTHRRRVNSG
jgi:hypothetical protein